MSDLSPEQITYNKSLFTSARNFINSCSKSGLDYMSMKVFLENAFKQPINIILSILNDEVEEKDYQTQISWRFLLIFIVLLLL
mgnify:CR=1 FL=1